MSISNMQVFDEFIMPATMDTLDQSIDKFNAASGGAIVLSSEGMTGDFARMSFFNSLASARRRVDRYAAQVDVAGTDLSEAQEVKVKVAGGFGPVVYEPSQMGWLERPTQQGVEAASSALADLILQDQLNTAISAGVGAISNNADVTNDVTGAQVTYRAINGGHALFGDMSGNLMADVMTGAMFHKLIDQNLANAERLFESTNVRIVNILGKLAIVTDAPALTRTVPAASDLVLSLSSGGLTVEGASSVVSNVETSNGKTRIETSFQADYDFVVGVKGYAWDTAAGGASPADADLGTGANWNKVANFDKMTAGVVTIGDQ